MDMSRLNSLNVHVAYINGSRIDVKIVPVSKDVQYRERREYRSDDEDSDYRITLRYNRLS
jgi:hypothetical protein